jgi:hypothetical protein
VGRQIPVFHPPHEADVAQERRLTGSGDGVFFCASGINGLFWEGELVLPFGGRL